MHSVKEKENALLTVFLTRGIKISLPTLREMRSRNSKLQKQPNKYGQVRHLMVPFSNALSLMSKNVEREKEKEATTVWIHIYLQGVFKSTFVDFNIRSTDDWLPKGGRGEWSLSNDHILCLAKRINLHLYPSSHSVTHYIAPLYSFAGNVCFEFFFFLIFRYKKYVLKKKYFKV